MDATSSVSTPKLMYMLRQHVSSKPGQTGGGNQGGNPGRELHLAKWQTEKISEAADDDTEKVVFLCWGRHVCGALVWFEGVKVCEVSVCRMVWSDWRTERT